MLMVIALSACAEASIIIFSFYWAPWIASAFSPAESGEVVVETTPLGGVLDTSESAGASEDAAGTRFLAAGTVEAVAIPYILIYSTLMMSAMLGQTCISVVISCTMHQPHRMIINSHVKFDSCFITFIFLITY